MDLLSRCRDRAHTFYADLLVAAEKSLSEALFEQSKTSASNDEQRQFYEAMQQLTRQSASMHQVFQQQLEQAYRRFVTGEDRETSIEDRIDVAKLSLVQRDQLEDDLAVSVMISKANSRNTQALWKLNRRLAVLRRGKPVADETNPFAPETVCRALQSAIHCLEIETRPRIFVYKQLGKLYVLSFEKILDRLNQELIDQGVLPNLKFVISNTPGATDEPAVPEQAEPSPSESELSLQHQHEMYQAIRSLQRAGGVRSHTASGISWGGIATDGEGGKDTFAPMDYAMILSAIQQSRDLLLAARAGKPLSIDQVEKLLIDRLQKQARPESQHKIARNDADMVDLVGMIFRYMLDDPKLGDAVKSLLSHLHTPYLKLALMENDFVDNLQHPARRLLNSMAEVGGLWVEDENDRTVLPKIKTVVETILQGFVDDESLFADLLEDFSRFRESLEKRAAMVEKRNTEAQEGMERLELARQRGREELIERLLARDIGESIQGQLIRPWSEFLSFHLLRHGEQSAIWKSALKVVDGVIWSVTVQPGQDKVAFRRHQQELLDQVRQGLQTMGYNAQDAESLLQALREAQELAYHQLVMESEAEPEPPAAPAQSGSVAPAGAAPAAAPARPAPRPSPVRKKVASKPPAEEDSLNDEERKMLNTLKDIAFGTWFAFQGRRSKNDVRMLKLAWYSKVSSHYMFVDQAGVKQAVETRSGLAKGIVAGRIRFAELEKRSFMERALETILSRLKLAD